MGTKEWIFTFGFDHEHPVYGPLRNRFVRIRGSNEEARLEMVRRFGQKWAFQYPSEEKAGVARWGLSELELS